MAVFGTVAGSMAILGTVAVAVAEVGSQCAVGRAGRSEVRPLGSQ